MSGRRSPSFSVLGKGLLHRAAQSSLSPPPLPPTEGPTEGRRAPPPPPPPHETMAWIGGGGACGGCGGQGEKPLPLPGRVRPSLAGAWDDGPDMRGRKQQCWLYRKSLPRTHGKGERRYGGGSYKSKRGSSSCNGRGARTPSPSFPRNTTFAPQH